MKLTALLALGALLSSSALADTIVIKGSDTLGAKMVPQLKDAYVAAGNKTDFEIAAEGSSQAFTALESGTAQIGMSSRDVKETEKNKFIAKGTALVEHVAGWDMIAVVTNKKNGVRNLTLKQIEGIFTGDIKNWSEIGGKDGEISVYTRNTASGTYKTSRDLRWASATTVRRLRSSLVTSRSRPRSPVTKTELAT
jgi:phosphate transport system substrate-binding protein